MSFIKTFRFGTLLLLATAFSCGNNDDNGTVPPPPPPPGESPTPAISLITPKSVSNAGGTEITLYGSGFVKGATVTFSAGQTSGVNPLFESDSELKVTTPTFPAGTVGPITVTVTNPDGKKGSRDNLLSTSYSQVDFTSSVIPVPPSMGGMKSGPSALIKITQSGDPHEVIANSKDNSVVVRGWDPVNKTLKTSANISLPGGRNPVALTSGDFDGDGIEDLAVAAHDTSNVFILFGKDTGEFQLTSLKNASWPNATTVKGTPTQIVAGDFNADGRLDLAVISTDIPVAMGTTTGILILAGVVDENRLFVLQTPTAPLLRDFALKSLLVADFNQDGKLDLASNTSIESFILLNTTSMNNYSFQTEALNTLGAQSLVYGDFTGNQGLSLAAPYQQPQGDGVLSFVVNSHTTPGVDPTYQVVDNPLHKSLQSPTLSASGDFDGDGIADLAVINTFGSGFENVSILLSNGDGTFRAIAPNLHIGKSPSAIITGDFDKDGKTDILVANSDDDTVSLFRNVAQ